MRPRTQLLRLFRRPVFAPCVLCACSGDAATEITSVANTIAASPDSVSADVGVTVLSASIATVEKGKTVTVFRAVPKPDGSAATTGAIVGVAVSSIVLVIGALICSRRWLPDLWVGRRGGLTASLRSLNLDLVATPFA